MALQTKGTCCRPSIGSGSFLRAVHDLVNQNIKLCYACPYTFQTAMTIRMTFNITTLSIMILIITIHSIKIKCILHSAQ
jgi:hypothetical protein